MSPAPAWLAFAAKHLPVLEREARALGRNPRAAAIHCAMGRVWEQLGDRRAAMRCYQNAWELDPRHLPALSAARALFESAGNLAAALALSALESQAAGDDGERAEVLLQRAAILARLDRAAEARAALMGAVALDPRRPASVLALLDLLGPDGDPSLLAALHVHAAALASDPAAARAHLLAASRLHEERDDPARAMALAAEAHAADLSDQAALGALDRLCARVGAWESLAAALRRSAEAVPADAAPALRRRLARILTDRLGRPEEARAELESALLAGPDSLLLEELSALHEAAGCWPELVDVLRTRLDTTTGEARGRLALALSSVLEEKLGDLAGALAAAREAAALLPRDAAALSALGRLFSRVGDHEGVLATYLAQAEATSDPRQRALHLYKAGALLEERLMRSDDAAARYREALELAPGLLPAFRALTRLCERAGRWDELVALLEAELAGGPDLDTRVAILTRIAAIHEEARGDLERAAEALSRALAASPDHLPTLRALQRVQERAGNWREAALAFEREAALTADLRATLALLHRAAEIFEEQVGDPAAATSAYEKLLALDPRYAPALRALSRLYRAAGRWDAYARMLREEAELETDPKRASETYCRLAEILLRHQGDTAGAEMAYRAALERAPGHAEALSSLARSCAARGAWSEVAAAHRARARAASSAQERADALVRAGEVLEERVGRFDLAAEAFSEALAAWPGHAWAARGLLRARAALGDPARLEKALAMTAQAPLGAAEREGLRRRLAVLQAAKGAASLPRVQATPATARGRAAAALAEAERLEVAGDVERALSFYRTALEEDRGDLVALRGLGRCAAALGRWEEAAAALEREAALARASSGAADALATAAQIVHARLRDPAHAEQLCQQALALDPLHPRASAELGALREEAGDQAGVVRFHEERAAALGTGPAAAEAWAQAARVRLERLGDAAGARDALQKALAANPAQPVALALAARLAEEAGDPSRAVALWRRRAEAEGAPEEAARARFAAAALLMDRLGDMAAAQALLAEGLATLPDDQAALERLARAAEALGDGSGAAAALERLLTLEREPGARARHLAALAALAERRSDSLKAAHLYEELAALAPSEVRPHERLAALWAELGDPFKQVKALEARAALSPSRAEAKPWLEQAAKVYDRALGNPSRAILALRGALEGALDDVEIRAYLADLLSREPATRAAAIQEHRAVLARDAFRLESYHALFQLHLAGKRLDGAWCAAAALAALRAANPEEARFLQDHRPPAPPEGAALGASQRNELMAHPDERGPLADLLAAFAPELGRLWPPDTARPTLERAPADHPLRRRVEALARRLGGVELDLLLDRARPLACQVEATEPPTLVVGVELARRFRDKEQLFLLGRCVARVARGNFTVDRLDPQELATLCAAAVRLVRGGNPGFGKRDDALARDLARVLSRKARKALEEAAARVRASPPADFAAFHAALRYTADRAGLLLSEDLAAAVVLSARPEPALRAAAPEQVMELIRPSRAAAELLAFAVGEEHLKLRAALGAAVS